MPRYLSGLSVLAIIACGATLPEGPLTGTWGGADAAVIATTSMVEVRMPCSRFVFGSALDPDAEGSFSIEGTALVPLSWAGSEARLEGQASGDRLHFRVLVRLGIGANQWSGEDEVHVADRDWAYSPGNPTCIG